MYIYVQVNTSTPVIQPVHLGNMLIVLYTMFGLGMCHKCTGCVSIYLSGFRSVGFVPGRARGWLCHVTLAGFSKYDCAGLVGSVGCAV